MISNYELPIDPEGDSDHAIVWAGAAGEARVPREVATCPGCRGTLVALVEKANVFTGVPLELTARCSIHTGTHCLPDVLDAPDIHPPPNPQALLADAAARDWAYHHVRAPVYMPRN